MWPAVETTCAWPCRRQSHLVTYFSFNVASHFVVTVPLLSCLVFILIFSLFVVVPGGHLEEIGIPGCGHGLCEENVSGASCLGVQHIRDHNKCKISVSEELRLILAYMRSLAAGRMWQSPKFGLLLVSLCSSLPLRHFLLDNRAQIRVFLWSVINYVTLSSDVQGRTFNIV